MALIAVVADALRFSCDFKIAVGWYNIVYCGLWGWFGGFWWVTSLVCLYLGVSGWSFGGVSGWVFW